LNFSLLTAAAVLVVGAAISAPSRAGTVGPGGILTLGNSYTNASPTVTTAGSVVDNDISANSASTYTYSDSFTSAQTTIAAAGVPANTYGFYDNFVFTISGSDADSITSTINLTSGAINTSLINLDAQLFLLSGNASLPSFEPNNMVTDSLSVSSFTLSPNVSGSTVVLDPSVSLNAGTYVLEIRGFVNGNAGGSYSGSLNVTPVPLPASTWLALSGLGALSLWGRRRKR
jgi:hypothetical protein